MATEKFLNLDGLAEVAEHVNKKLRIVSTMPALPTDGDMVIYNGAASADYKQGSTYRYEITETYYMWSDLSDNYYTKAEAPNVGDTVYSDTSGTDSGYIVDSYDSVNNQVVINSLTYDRDTTGDTPIKDWVSKSGGTSVILNKVDKTGDQASFYAPVGSGNEGQILVSNGDGQAPSWTSYSGYAPVCIDNSLCFYYGVIPDVENTSIVFEL